jgi:hypothetical protein
MMLYVETVFDGSSCITNTWNKYGCPGVVHEVYGNSVSLSNYNKNKCAHLKCLRLFCLLYCILNCILYCILNCILNCILKCILNCTFNCFLVKLLIKLLNWALKTYC